MTGLEQYSVEQQMSDFNLWLHCSHNLSPSHTNPDVPFDVPASACLDWNFFQPQAEGQFPGSWSRFDLQQNLGKQLAGSWVTSNVISNKHLSDPTNFTQGEIEFSPNSSIDFANTSFVPLGEVGFQNIPSSPESASITSYSSIRFQTREKVHGRITSATITQCDECNTLFPTKASLYLHSQQKNHSPHFCLCGKAFSRLDVLDRHIQSLNYVSTTFPCPHCKRHRGIKAFRRRDHLTQHLKGYHNMDITSDLDDCDSSEKPKQSAKRKREKLLKCPHKDCSSSIHGVTDGIENCVQQSNESVFRTQSQLTQHLRELHDECLFPCREDRCSRVGGRGFFRKRDLMKHMKEYHLPGLNDVPANFCVFLEGKSGLKEKII